MDGMGRGMAGLAENLSTQPILAGALAELGKSKIAHV